MAKVLVIGSGGREHAICRKFAASPQVEKVYAAPGNPGMRDCAELADIAVSDFAALASFARSRQIDLTFVGPEIPLCNGIADEFHRQGLTIFGPDRQAARIEGSKIFAKQMMAKYRIPTAASRCFDRYEEALAYLRLQPLPIVLKADGLAAGKGVVIAQTRAEAEQELAAMMQGGKFQQAGSRVVIEEFLRGEEFSLLAFVNGTTVVPMQIAQDHKRAYDHDLGPNTGGMGAYTPVAQMPQAVLDEALNRILKPMAEAMAREGCPFTGVLYAGCMNTDAGVKTIEFNCRFGDPETEVILPAMEDDLYQVVSDVLNHVPVTLHWSKDFWLGVVLASKGYPGHYDKGAVIEGLDAVGANVFHMGTAEKDGRIVTAGGRVLFVYSHGRTLREAQQKAYELATDIHCDNLYCRTDIGARGIR